MAMVNGLREVQSASGEELSALMPSVLDKVCKEVFDHLPKSKFRFENMARITSNE